MKVSFIGAGPGDPELITLKGRARIEAANIIIYAGSLVNPALLDWAGPGTQVYDSAGMTLEAVLDLYAHHQHSQGLIARLHTGDPSVYGAIQEQIDFCIGLSLEVEVVPGVSSVFAAAASLQRELTLPDISQTLILTRAPGRTPVPRGQEPAALSTHRATMALYLSAAHLTSLIQELLPAYGPDCPICLVHRASWPDERIVRGTLATIEDGLAADASIRMQGQLMILVGQALDPARYGRSRLYDPSFSHAYREGRQP